MNHQSNNDPQAGQNRPLPKKEGDLFKAVVKHYESKQYKKGIKAADNILRKFPNHGETLAMKGLTLNCMQKRDEAYDFVRKGLRYDMRSHVCWHVFGLLHRSDRNYNEAIKAYKQALRIDEQNLQILRDLSLLQIQMRDLDGFVITRHKILTLKPNNKNHWLAFALAKHLTSDREGAISVIDIYLGTLNAQSPELQRGFESGELAMYRNKILGEIEGGESRALDHLIECRSVVVDGGAWLYAKGTYELRLGLFADAKQSFLDFLVDRGAAENYRVHTGYMCAVLEMEREVVEAAIKLKGNDTLATMIALTSEQKQLLLDSYQVELKKFLPRSHAVRRIPTTILEGEALRAAVDLYCRRDLNRGVPCLGSDLHALILVQRGKQMVRLVDSVDIKVHPTMIMLIALVDEYILSLSTTSKFPDVDEVVQTEEPPSTLLWTFYLRALLHQFCGEYQEALKVVEKCLQHTPTAVDVYELKAILLEYSGDVESAADCLDAGRELDKQDRYINNQTTKFMLRANRVELARERIALFSKHEGNPEQNLYDMQCAWYELELAACYARAGHYGKSLKKYMAVEKHFEDFHEDQFDFHSYCIRKVTLRAYVDVLRFENELFAQHYYGKAAKGIIDNYIHLHDFPEHAKVDDETSDYSKMTAAERKKAKAIARKKKKAIEKKALRQAEERRGDASNKLNGNDKKKLAQQGSNGGVLSFVEEDPDGKELLKRDPLSEAKRYVATLVKNAPNRFGTWILQYDVAIRREKTMMALQALFKAKSIDSGNCELFDRVVHFALIHQKISDDGAASKSTPCNQNCNTKCFIITKVIDKLLSNLLEDQTVQNFVKSKAQQVKADALTDLPTRIAVADALTRIQHPTLDAITLITDGGLQGRQVTVPNCKKALKFLTSLGEEASQARNIWLTGIQSKFQLATDFKEL